MTTFATTFKSEVARIARRELKRAIAPLKSSVAKSRSIIVTLKSQVASLKVQVAKPVPATVPSVSDKELKKARFSGGLVKKLRNKLGLSQAVFGKLVGVSGLTVLHWEKGRKIKPKYHKAIVALRKMGKREVGAMAREGNRVAE